MKYVVVTLSVGLPNIDGEKLPCTELLRTANLGLYASDPISMAYARAIKECMRDRTLPTSSYIIPESEFNSVLRQLRGDTDPAKSPSDQSPSASGS